MKEILSFIHKEFLHIFRDARTMLIVLGMPVVQILLFGFAISTEVRNATVDIVGDPCDAAIRDIVPKLENNNNLSFGRFLDSPAQAEERLRKGESKAVVLFNTGYDRDRGSGTGAAVSIICDGSDPNTAQMVGNYVKSILTDVNASVIPSPSVKLVYNPSMNSSYNFVPGVMGLILMLICSMMTAVSIVKEKEFGTLELVLVSPVRPAWIIISKPDSLSCILDCQLFLDSFVGEICDACADERQFHHPVACIIDFRGVVTWTRAVDFDDFLYSADGSAHLRYGTYHAYDDVCRHHLPL